MISLTYPNIQIYNAFTQIIKSLPYNLLIRAKSIHLDFENDLCAQTFVIYKY